MNEKQWEASKKRAEGWLKACEWFTCFDQYAEPYLDFSFYPTYDKIIRNVPAGKSIEDMTWYGWRVTIDTYEGVAWWSYVGSFPDLGQEAVSEEEIGGWKSMIDDSVLSFCEVLKNVTGIEVAYERG